MNTRILALALGAIALGSAASAQDELPYYQSQRVVVIFKVEDRLVVNRMDGTEVEVLDSGYYRYEAKTRSQSVLTQENWDDQTGPYSAYGNGPRGEIRGLFTNALKREATASLKVTDIDLGGRRNVVNAGELEIHMRVELGQGSSTSMRMKGNVARNGAFVPGELDNYYSSNGGKIKVYHTFLSVENHLPQVKPEAFFPAQISATATPTPTFEIEAGTYNFSLSRGDQSPLGVQDYDGTANFPAVEESDYYGDYESSARGAEILVKENGEIYVSFSWGLTGRYHGWSHEYTATLTPAQFDELKTTGRLQVTGKATYRYAGEMDVFDDETPCAITLETPVAAPAPAVAGLAGALGGN